MEPALAPIMVEGIEDRPELTPRMLPAPPPTLGAAWVDPPPPAQPAILFPTLAPVPIMPMILVKRSESWTDVVVVPAVPRRQLRSFASSVLPDARMAALLAKACAASPPLKSVAIC